VARLTFGSIGGAGASVGSRLCGAQKFARDTGSDSFFLSGWFELPWGRRTGNFIRGFSWRGDIRVLLLLYSPQFEAVYGSEPVKVLCLGGPM